MGRPGGVLHGGAAGRKRCRVAVVLLPGSDRVWAWTRVAASPLPPGANRRFAWHLLEQLCYDLNFNSSAGVSDAMYSRHAVVLGLAWALMMSSAAAQEAKQGSDPATADGDTDPARAPAAEPGAATAESTTTDRVTELEAKLATQQAQLDAQAQALQTLQAASAPPATGARAQPAALAEDDALAELLASDADASLEEYATPDALRLYGYMDMGLQRLVVPNDLLIGQVAPTDKTTFVFGNVNLYVDVNPSNDWRGLFEVRFTNLAHGLERSFEVPGVSSYQRVDRSVTNATSPDGRDKIVLGSIMIERAWMQWQKHPLFQVRTGQFLTPFGIWNVDHGTPVLIGLLQPDFQISQSFPARQLGVQVLGEMGVGAWSLGYHATVSNGRTPGQFDLTNDKAIGARAHATYRGESTVKVGLSGYWGSVDDQIKRVTAFSPVLQLQRVPTVAGHEGVAGVDVSLDAGSFRLRAEGVVARVDFQDGRHAPAAYAQPGATVPNHYYSDAYLLGAYRLGQGLENALERQGATRGAPGPLHARLHAVGRRVHDGQVAGDGIATRRLPADLRRLDEPRALPAARIRHQRVCLRRQPHAARVVRRGRAQRPGHHRRVGGALASVLTRDAPHAPRVHLTAQAKFRRMTGARTEELPMAGLPLAAARPRARLRQTGALGNR